MYEEQIWYKSMRNKLEELEEKIVKAAEIDAYLYSVDALKKWQPPEDEFIYVAPFPRGKPLDMSEVVVFSPHTISEETPPEDEEQELPSEECLIPYEIFLK